MLGNDCLHPLRRGAPDRQAAELVPAVAGQRAGREEDALFVQLCEVREVLILQRVELRVVQLWGIRSQDEQRDREVVEANRRDLSA